MTNAFRDLIAQEQAQMASIVEKAMQDGALGLSTGLIYVPVPIQKPPKL